MKKILFVLAIAVLVISVSSCGNKKQKAVEKAGTHSHEDGTVHKDDAHEHDVKPNQEAFEVNADKDAEHKHEGGDVDNDDHEHEHGDVDSHDSDAEHKHAEGDTEGHEHSEHK